MSQRHIRYTGQPTPPKTCQHCMPCTRIRLLSTTSQQRKLCTSRMNRTQRICQPCTTCNHERHSPNTYLLCTAGTKFRPSLRTCLPHTCRNLQSLLMVPLCHLHRLCIVSDQRCPEICRLDTQCMLPRCCSSSVSQPRNPGTYCRLWRCLHDSRIVLGCTCDGGRTQYNVQGTICH